MSILFLIRLLFLRLLDVLLTISSWRRRAVQPIFAFVRLLMILGNISALVSPYLLYRCTVIDSVIITTLNATLLIVMICAYAQFLTTQCQLWSTLGISFHRYNPHLIFLPSLPPMGD